jgi:hypothetical protein
MLSGFEAIYTGLTLPAGISWFAYADEGTYTGPGCFNCLPIQGNNNPGFEGVAVEAAVVSETPIPASLPLFGTGVGALSFISYRRKRKAS